MKLLEKFLNTYFIQYLKDYQCCCYYYLILYFINIKVNSHLIIFINFIKKNYVNF